MADSILRDKAKQFAKDIVFLCREIKASHKEAVLVNQLLRSATSIGANLHEAQYAQSKNDFISERPLGDYFKMLHTAWLSPCALLSLGGCTFTTSRHCVYIF